MLKAQGRKNLRQELALSNWNLPVVIGSAHVPQGQRQFMEDAHRVTNVVVLI
jgi:hypothetical protein